MDYLLQTADDGSPKTPKSITKSNSNSPTNQDEFFDIESQVSSVMLKLPITSQQHIGVKLEATNKIVDTLLKFLLLIMIKSESFHVVAHFLVLSRLYIFQALEGKRWYFVWDGLSCLICYLFVLQHLNQIKICSGCTNNIKWKRRGCNFIFHTIVLIHLFFHLGYYVPMWNSHYYAIRILRWSSQGYNGEWLTTDFYLTVFDILTHALLITYLFKYAMIRFPDIFEAKKQVNNDEFDGNVDDIISDVDGIKDVQAVENVQDVQEIQQMSGPGSPVSRKSSVVVNSARDEMTTLTIL